MKIRKTPMRQCLVTRERLPKEELMRIVRTPEKEIIVDTTGRINGRGAYLKKDVLVVETAKKKKILDHFLKEEVPESIYEELIKIIKERGEEK